MNVAAYYRRARSLGARAIEALLMAKEAAALDDAAAARRMPPPATVSREVMPDGTSPVSLSFAIKVF